MAEERKSPELRSRAAEEDIFRRDCILRVAAELQRLQKRADEAEEKELTDIAKKYEIIGKKPEDLVPY